MWKHNLSFKDISEGFSKEDMEREMKQDVLETYPDLDIDKNL